MTTFPCGHVTEYLTSKCSVFCWQNVPKHCIKCLSLWPSMSQGETQNWDYEHLAKIHAMGFIEWSAKWYQDEAANQG